MTMANLNLDFYGGKDLYFDSGEDRLLELLQSGKPHAEILAENNDWPLLYHLCEDRHNLLAWYPFQRETALLEIGGGCGALTGLFCDRVDQVAVVELSKKRSSIIATRLPAADNLEIIVGNINDVVFQQSFDYVTLIGVMEYAKSFFSEGDPYQQLLTKIRKILKPGGKLFVAIENQFGLKYFAGATEDHTGQLFDGLEGYPHSNRVETFGKYELESVLHQNGFTQTEFYYPFPDYKLPSEIFSDDYLPEPHHILQNAPNFDNNRYQLFDEGMAYVSIIKNKMFPFFSNSFLVVASP